MIWRTLIYASFSDREYRYVMRESLFENVFLILAGQGQDRTVMEFRKKTGVSLGSKLAITALFLLAKGEVFSTSVISVFLSSLAIML